MTYVDRWFAALSLEERKTVLYALHTFRSLTVSARSIATGKALWPHVEGLLHALEEDHESLKLSEEARPTIPSPRISGEFSVIPAPPEAKSK